jgi:hypothetical protein
MKGRDHLDACDRLHKTFTCSDLYKGAVEAIPYA